MYVEPAVIAADIVARGAVEGVKRLSEIGAVSYLTTRCITHDKRQHDAIVEATCAWLCEHQFKDAFRIQFCDRLVGKVSTLITIARATDELLVLIDDSAQRIVELDEGDRELLCDRLALVAFAQPRPGHVSLRTLHMPHWDIEPVARCLVEEEQSYATLRRTQRSTRNAQAQRSTGDAATAESCPRRPSRSPPLTTPGKITTRARTGQGQQKGKPL